jgi:hypothetical protein
MGCFGRVHTHSPNALLGAPQKKEKVFCALALKLSRRFFALRSPKVRGFPDPGGGDRGEHVQWCLPLLCSSQRVASNKGPSGGEGIRSYLLSSPEGKGSPGVRPKNLHDEARVAEHGRSPPPPRHLSVNRGAPLRR